MICVVYGHVWRSGDNSVQAFLFCQGLDSSRHLYLLSQLIGPSSAFLCVLLKGLLEAPLPFLNIRSAPTSKELFSESFPSHFKSRWQWVCGMGRKAPGLWANPSVHLPCPKARVSGVPARQNKT